MKTFSFHFKRSSFLSFCSSLKVLWHDKCLTFHTNSLFIVVTGSSSCNCSNCGIWAQTMVNNGTIVKCLLMCFGMYRCFYVTRLKSAHTSANEISDTLCCDSEGHTPDRAASVLPKHSRGRKSRAVHERTRVRGQMNKWT